MTSKITRRSFFLVAAAVVLLYFSVIIYMLNPLHGAKTTSYYGHHYMNNFPFRQVVPRVNWCNELRWRSPPSQNVVALASHPGSGNTWLRYLLQQVTGIVTGSVYMDFGLRVHGFPAENVTDGSVLVVKTHEAPPVDPNKFKSAILLIRNPRDAILADFNRLHKGHIGTAPKSAFLKSSSDHRQSEWVLYVSRQLSAWESMYELWLTRFPGALHVVPYERLVSDTRAVLQGILAFLNFTATEAAMNCALANKEGIYRRKKKHQGFDPFTADMYKALDEVRHRILYKVIEYNKRRNNNTDKNIASL